MLSRAWGKTARFVGRFVGMVIAALWMHSAAAVPVTYAYTGEVTSASGIFTGQGTSVSGTITFDDQLVTVGAGNFTGANNPMFAFSATLTVGAVTVSETIINPTAAQDARVSLTDGSGVDTARFQLVDNTTTFFTQFQLIATDQDSSVFPETV